MPDTFDPASVAWVLDTPSLKRLLAAIERAAEVVEDLETTGLDEQATSTSLTNGGVAARVVLASLTLPTAEQQGTERADTCVPLSHPESPWLGRWRAVLAKINRTIVNARKPLTNQHVKFDAKWVQATAKVDLAATVSWCTQVSSHLLDETTSTRLKERVPATFGVERWDDFDLTFPGAAEQVPMFDLGLYAARDTYWTWRLACLHREQMFLPHPGAPAPEMAEAPVGPDEVTDARLGSLARWCAMPMVATLTRIEGRGIALDASWTRRGLAEEQQAVTDLTKTLAHRLDGTASAPDPDDASFAPTSTWFMAWAQTAVERGDLRITALTPRGNPQWSKSVLIRQARHGSEVAQQLLDLRRAVKRAEYLASWLVHQAADGRIHTTYHAGRVITGRLSSEGPNMQQVTAALKPAFVPSPGYVLAELDYSQIELRVAAFISGCVPMVEAFQRGDDLHRILASRITGKTNLSEVTAEERQAGKSANFGLLYGMSPGGFQEYAETVYDVVFTEEEAIAVHQAFFSTWEGIAAWHRRAVNRAMATGNVASPIGRVRRLPQIGSGTDGGYSERAAVNAPVQGFASDLMQMAAASIEGMLPDADARVRLVGTVHDSIIAEVPEQDWQEAVRDCIQRMVSVDGYLRRLGCTFTIPLAVEAKVGTRWGLADLGVVES